MTFKESQANTNEKRANVMSVKESEFYPINIVYNKFTYTYHYIVFVSPMMHIDCFKDNDNDKVNLYNLS